jgi:hypothetical protein
MEVEAILFNGRMSQEQEQLGILSQQGEYQIEEETPWVLINQL